MSVYAFIGSTHECLQPVNFQIRRRFCRFDCLRARGAGDVKIRSRLRFLLSARFTASVPAQSGCRIWPPRQVTSLAVAMVLKEAPKGGACVALIKPKRKRGRASSEAPAETPRPCGREMSHAWYDGPTCKSCYERETREDGLRRTVAGRRVDPLPTAGEQVSESGGDIPLEVLTISV